MQQIINGDCRKELALIEAGSIDSIITDPPYGISSPKDNWEDANEVVKPQGAFENVKGFVKLPRNNPDGIKEYFMFIWKECFRVLKPGAFAFIMTPSRLDVLAQQILTLQEVGFETKFPLLTWCYSSGFQKNVNIGKAHPEYNGAHGGYFPKPAMEQILPVMKPLSRKTYTEQVMDNGKGVTWLGDCKIPCDDREPRFSGNILVEDRVIGEYSRYFDLDLWYGNILTVSKPNINEKGNYNNHPCVKPLKLMAFLVVLGSRENDIILDPFSGSGTTCLAAQMFNRRFIGVEQSSEYCAISQKRLEEQKDKIKTNIKTCDICGCNVFNQSFVIVDGITKCSLCLELESI